MQHFCNSICRLAWSMQPPQLLNTNRRGSRTKMMTNVKNVAPLQLQMMTILAIRFVSKLLFAKSLLHNCAGRTRLVTNRTIAIVRRIPSMPASSQWAYRVHSPIATVPSGSQLRRFLSTARSQQFRRLQPQTAIQRFFAYAFWWASQRSVYLSDS